ncbi:MAG: hypothetical protein EOO25_06740 [Comamonadaceae bacterium]|nr:MAG: hypothetical protein EOO25_06740 [Comamonadaceae bacterium]
MNKNHWTLADLDGAAFFDRASRGKWGWKAAGVVAATAVLAAGGYSAWRVRQAAELVRASEPFQALPASPARSLLVVGDSTAVGTGASDPTHSLAGLIAAAHPQLRIVNLAADGARYADFAQQLRSGEGYFDLVLVLGGGNDVIRLTGQGKLRQDVLEVAQLARKRGSQVILMPPGNAGNAPFFWRPLAWWMTRRSQALHAAVREAAQATGAAYVNLYKPRSQDPFAQRPKELHARDGLHPSDAGYALWLAELRRQGGLEARL